MTSFRTTGFPNFYEHIVRSLEEGRVQASIGAFWDLFQIMFDNRTSKGHQVIISNKPRGGWGGGSTHSHVVPSTLYPLPFAKTVNSRKLKLCDF